MPQERRLSDSPWFTQLKILAIVSVYILTSLLLGVSSKAEVRVGDSCGEMRPSFTNGFVLRDPRRKVTEMKITVPILAGLVGSLAMTSGASALVASTHAVIQDITATYAGLPGYGGLHSFAVFVLYQSASDVMVNHGLASITATGGTFFNGNPAVGSPDNPLGLIAPTGGLTPVNPAFFAIPGYGVWRWDTNLSLDNNPLSQADPGSAQTPTSIVGGAFIVPPPIGALAGADLMIQIAQITLSSSSTQAHGSTMVNTVNPAGGNPIVTQIFIDIPGPGALALLGVAGLVGTRRRRA